MYSMYTMYNNINHHRNLIQVDSDPTIYCFNAFISHYSVIVRK